MYDRGAKSNSNGACKLATRKTRVRAAQKRFTGQKNAGAERNPQTQTVKRNILLYRLRLRALFPADRLLARKSGFLYDSSQCKGNIKTRTIDQCKGNISMQSFTSQRSVHHVARKHDNKHGIKQWRCHRGPHGLLHWHHHELAFFSP